MEKHSNEELHYLYISVNIFLDIQVTEHKMGGHVARMMEWKCI